MSIQTTISRGILLLILGGLILMLYSYANHKSSEAEPIVRETYECLAAICRTLPGAGDVCVFQKPRITRISIIDDGGAKTIRFTPTNDRCTDGSD